MISTGIDLKEIFLRAALSPGGGVSRGAAFRCFPISSSRRSTPLGGLFPLPWEEHLLLNPGFRLRTLGGTPPSRTALFGVNNRSLSTVSNFYSTGEPSSKTDIGDRSVATGFRTGNKAGNFAESNRRGWGVPGDKRPPHPSRVVGSMPLQSWPFPTIIFFVPIFLKKKLEKTENDKPT